MKKPTASPKAKPKSAKEKKALLRLVHNKLLGLDKDLSECDEAMKQGEVEIADLDWEGEFAGPDRGDS